MVVLPAPHVPVDNLTGMLEQLLQADFLVLCIVWDAEPSYPEALAILPGAMDFLLNLEEVAPDHVGALGIGLGADIVLRSASTDRQIRSVLAIEPYLSVDFDRASRRPRLWRPRVTEWGSFVERMDTLAALQHLVERPVRIILSDEERSHERAAIVQALAAKELSHTVVFLPDEKSIGMLANPAAIEMMVNWMTETLR